MKRLNFRTNIVLPLSMAMGIFILPSLAQATVIVGGNLFVQNTGNVYVTFKSSSAGYTSTLSFNGQNLFTNHADEGTTLNLGSFSAGTALNFQLLVHNTGNTFSTGMGALNPDGIAHTLVNDMGTGSTQVGWEDLLGGGDLDYNDLVFEFSNTTTEDDKISGNQIPGSEDPGKLIANPEPSTMILFGSGLLGLGAWRLRKKQS